MRTVGITAVVLGAVVFLGWYTPFEGICSGAALVIIVVAARAFRRASALEEDDEEVYPDNPSRLRDFTFGAGIGLLWLALASAMIWQLRSTRVHGWFVDDAGAAVVRDLNVLGQNEAWDSILTRLNHPLPPRLGQGSQAAINNLHYLALAHKAAQMSDPLSRCSAERDAEAFARRHAVDPVTRFPVTPCPAGQLVPLAKGEQVSVLREANDPLHRSMLTVIVTGSSGAPVIGLDKENFVAFAGGREVTIVTAEYAPRVSPNQNYEVVIAPLRSRAADALAETALAIMQRSRRPNDGIKISRCRPRGEDIVALLRAASSHPASAEGAVFVVTQRDDLPGRDLASDLLDNLKRSKIPMHLVVVGTCASAVPNLSWLAASSGGSRICISSNNELEIRKLFSIPFLHEGVYFLTLDGHYRNVGVALTSISNGSNK